MAKITLSTYCCFGRSLYLLIPFSILICLLVSVSFYTGLCAQDSPLACQFSGLGFNVGPSPLALAIGDLNGDGTPDFAAANEIDGTVSIVLNHGNNTFQQQAVYFVGAGARSIVLGDVDNDSDLDIATANFDDDSVSILENLGNGIFTRAMNLDAGTNTRGVEFGDFNNDGMLDIVSANAGTNDVSFFRIWETDPLHPKFVFRQVRPHVQFGPQISTATTILIWRSPMPQATAFRYCSTIATEGLVRRSKSLLEVPSVRW